MVRRLQGWKEKVGGWEVSQLVRQSLQEERMAFVVRPPSPLFKPSGHCTAPVSLAKHGSQALRRGRVGTLFN